MYARAYIGGHPGRIRSASMLLTKALSSTPFRQAIASASGDDAGGEVAAVNGERALRKSIKVRAGGGGFFLWGEGGGGAIFIMSAPRAGGVAAATVLFRINVGIVTGRGAR